MVRRGAVRRDLVDLGVQRDPELASADARTRLRSFLNRPRWTEVYCLYRRDVLLTSPMFQPEYGADVLLTWWFLLRAPLVVIDEPLVEYRTYPVKSADATAESLNPTATRRQDAVILELEARALDAKRLQAEAEKQVADKDVDLARRRIELNKAQVTAGGQ